jgi:hypothetical protein
LVYHQTWGKLKVSGEGEKNNDDDNTIYYCWLYRKKIKNNFIKIYSHFDFYTFQSKIDPN